MDKYITDEIQQKVQKVCASLDLITDEMHDIISLIQTAQFRDRFSQFQKAKEKIEEEQMYEISQYF